MSPNKRFSLGGFFHRSRSKSPRPAESTRVSQLASLPANSLSPSTSQTTSRDPLAIDPAPSALISPLPDPKRSESCANTAGGQNSNLGVKGLPTITHTTPPKHNSPPASSRGKTADGGRDGWFMANAVALPLPMSDAADETFREALESYNKRLSSEQRKAFLEARSLSATELISTIDELNQQHSEKSNTRKCANKVQGFLEVVDGYLNALAICIQHHPDISSLVVGGLRLFVDLGRRYAGFFEKLSETMERLGGHLTYLAKYAELYSKYPEVKKALCDAYGDLLDFCKIVYGIFVGEDGKLSEKISAVVLLKQLTSPLETKFNAINSRFDEHLSTIERTANILEQRRKIFKEWLEAREKAALDRRNLLSWLSKLEPEDDYDRIYAKRHGNTGRWFLESEAVRHWFTIIKPCLLWCYGDPGVGKSVITSILLGEIITKHIFNDRIGIAFFYFNFQSKTTQAPADVLSILIKQLCRRKNDIPQSLTELYERCIFNDKAPKLAELEVQFREIIDTFEEVFLVIDAMDECNEDHRKQFLPYVVKLFQETKRLKIFVASRPEKDIGHIFTSSEFETIKIEAKKVDEDITTYVRHVLAHQKHNYCDIDGDLRQEVENVLVSQSGGMFLWVKCQLDYLYQQPSTQDIKDALKSLPTDITATYRRMLARIHNKPEAMKVLAKRALTWVITSRRPLNPEELAIAVAIETTSNSSIDLEQKYKPNAAIDACCGLLTIESEVVRPIHFTVQEFLKGIDGIDNGVNTNIELARSSVQYMLCNEFAILTSYIKNDEMGCCPNDSNMRYIFQYWDHHIRAVSLPFPRDLEDLLRRFFSSKNCRTAYCAKAMSFSEASPLDLCAISDLLPVYCQFHALDGSIAGLNESKQVLRNAARGGSVSAISTLLGLTGPVDFIYNDLLYLAAEAGHGDAVLFFLDRGADINAKYESTATALYIATHNGRKNVVKILTENGADVNIQGGKYGTALQAAAYNGHETIVNCFLANGANVNIQGGKYGTALQAAVYHGNETIVNCLLANGADVNIQGGKYGTALQAASSNWDRRFPRIHLSVTLNVIKMLLDKGANVNIQGGKYDSALAAARKGQATEIVKILLERGAKDETI